MRRQLHDDLVLIKRVIDGGNRALAVGIIQCVVDFLRRDVIGRGDGTVDHHIGFQPALLQIGIDVQQVFLFLQRGDDFRDPQIKRIAVTAGQGILVFRIALPRTDLQILRRDQESGGPGDPCQRPAQTSDDGGSRNFTLRQRFQRDENEAVIGGPPAGESGHGGNALIMLNDGLQLRHFFLHQRE